MSDPDIMHNGNHVPENHLHSNDKGEIRVELIPYLHPLRGILGAKVGFVNLRACSVIAKSRICRSA